VPLLQPIALHRKIRTRLRSRRDMLPELRDAALKGAPGGDVEAVRLERLRPRTVLSIIGGAIAAYYLMSALTSVDLVQLITEADPGWVAVTLVASALTFVGAALSLMGFVPIRLPIVRTFLAQLASSFAKLVAPAAVGTVALNARFLQKAGLEPALAVAAVGVSQVFAFVIYIVLLLVFGLLTGTNSSSQLVPSEAIVIGLAIALVVLMVGMVIPPVRHWIVGKVQPTFARVAPRMVDMLQSPIKLAQGVGGNLLMTIAFIAALYASVRAFGGSVSFVTLAVVWMAGSAIGSAAPTPGGLGAVEAALAAGLTAAGLPGGTAVSAVLLFRVATFWLPVAPGWLAFHILQRRDAL
jgi:glycosyltransferase 2 family protein